jgi:thiol-disulfide isomerase/thioredoxin
MTLRLLLLFALAGGVAWFRLSWQRARRADVNRPTAGLPDVPSALRGGGAAWIIFTTPTCVACRTVEQLLVDHRPGERVVRVDATTDPDLAARWEVRRAPTTLRVDAGGKVVRRLVGAEAVRHHLATIDSDDGGSPDSEPLDAASER